MPQEFSPADCPFCAILAGDEPGTIIDRDEEHSFILIKSIHPESAVHWLAMPMEHVCTVEELEQNNSKRFLELVNFAVQQAKKHSADYPELERGFTLKMHFGSFQTVPHAKIHILAVE